MVLNHDSRQAETEGSTSTDRWCSATRPLLGAAHSSEVHLASGTDSKVTQQTLVQLLQESKQLQVCVTFWYGIRAIYVAHSSLRAVCDNVLLIWLPRSMPTICCNWTKRPTETAYNSARNIARSSPRKLRQEGSTTMRRTSLSFFPGSQTLE